MGEERRKLSHVSPHFRYPHSAEEGATLKMLKGTKSWGGQLRRYILEVGTEGLLPD